MPCQPLDAPENLSKEAPRQAALGQQEDEVPRMPDQAPAGLEQPLLETGERPALDGDRQDEPTQQIAKVIGDDAEQEADLIGPEPVTGEPGPVGGFLGVLDSLLGRPTLVVEANDGPIRPGQDGNGEPHDWSAQRPRSPAEASNASPGPVHCEVRRRTAATPGAQNGHSITSSARNNSDGGIVSPSAFAVLLLMTNSNRVACRSGSSLGRAPARILATCSAAIV